MSFCTDLPITEIAILSTLSRFEGCLEVEGWLKTGNKSHSFRGWLSLRLLPTFLVVLLIRDKAACYLIKVVTMRKLLILVAKMTKLWLGIVQHLVRWPPFFILFLQSACLREHLYKIRECKKEPGEEEDRIKEGREFQRRIVAAEMLPKRRGILSTWAQPVKRGSE